VACGLGNRRSIQLSYGVVRLPLVCGGTRTIPLDARNEPDANAELALFNRDRAGHLTGRQSKERALAEKARSKQESVFRDDAQQDAGPDRGSGSLKPCSSTSWVSTYDT
jgi:hypothetical protein